MATEEAYTLQQILPMTASNVQDRYGPNFQMWQGLGQEYLEDYFGVSAALALAIVESDPWWLDDDVPEGGITVRQWFDDTLVARLDTVLDSGDLQGWSLADFGTLGTNWAANTTRPGHPH